MSLAMVLELEPVKPGGTMVMSFHHLKANDTVELLHQFNLFLPIALAFCHTCSGQVSYSLRRYPTTSSMILTVLSDTQSAVPWTDSTGRFSAHWVSPHV